MLAQVPLQNNPFKASCHDEIHLSWLGTRFSQVEMNELPASKTNISFCMRILLCLFSSLGKKTAVCQRAFLSAARAAFEPAEAELLSCAWRQPRSNRNQKSSQSSQIKALMQDWNELADEKGNFELQGTCGQARCEPELKLGALSNANLLPDPGSKILPTFLEA